MKYINILAHSMIIYVSGLIFCLFLGPDIKAGAVWRLVTPIILHAGIIHILGNLFFQTRFGYTLELRWGKTKFLIIYICSGIMAAFWSTVISFNTISVGASGALFGLVGADLSYLIYNWVEIPHRQQEAFFLAVMTIINFLMGASSTGIDNYAHLGGLVGNKKKQKTIRIFC
jgi:rhomboid protease GluP